MHLPQEIRDEIYANVFRSIHFTHKWYDEGRRAGTSTPETGLALLRTCHRVRDEIGLFWLHHVLFDFSTPRKMLDVLADIPITLRRQIRYVCVSGNELMTDHEPWSPYHTSQVLKMLPGLELDTLTVIVDQFWGPLASFRNLYDLIRDSDGWKELHYLLDSPEPFAYKAVVFDVNNARMLRTDCSPRPQPSDLQNTLEQRDGQASHPSVVVYQAAATAAPGADMPVLHPCIQKVFNQLREVFAPYERFLVKLEDATPIALEQFERRHFLVVVKRGVGVEYAEKEGSPYLPYGDMREDFPGMTWKEIRVPPVTEHDDDDDDDWY